MNITQLKAKCKAENNSELDKLDTKLNKARADKKPFKKILNRMQNLLFHILKEKNDNID